MFLGSGAVALALAIEAAAATISGAADDVSVAAGGTAAAEETAGAALIAVVRAAVINCSPILWRPCLILCWRWRLSSASLRASATPSTAGIGAGWRADWGLFEDMMKNGKTARIERCEITKNNTY